MDKPIEERFRDHLYYLIDILSEQLAVLHPKGKAPVAPSLLGTAKTLIGLAYTPNQLIHAFISQSWETLWPAVLERKMDPLITHCDDAFPMIPNRKMGEVLKAIFEEHGVNSTTETFPPAIDQLWRCLTNMVKGSIKYAVREKKASAEKQIITAKCYPMLQELDRLIEDWEVNITGI